MGSLVEPSTSCVKIKVDESYPFDNHDDIPVYDTKLKEIRSNVEFEKCYKQQKQIGDGKFGKVFLVTEKSTGNEFAAKFIRIKKEADRQEVQREVSILKQLRHPRIAQIYDAFYTTSGEVVLIMEIVRGGELFDRVGDDNYILTEQAVAMIICQLCEAIHYIHEQHIIHLDIKPENIMCVSQTGNRIKLIDFGLARYYDGTQELKYMAGTPEFAAPEVIKFEQLHFHTDMWSVGVITYILLSGYSPFLGENLGETYCNVEKGEWGFEDGFEEVSEEAKDFISKLLVYEPKRRMLPKDCLQHTWIARHRDKARCDKQLDKPGEGKKMDNKLIMKYNVRRKFHRVVSIVKFLIELNKVTKLIGSLSTNGRKYFEPMLKMTEEKERKLKFISASIERKKDVSEVVCSLVKAVDDSISAPKKARIEPTASKPPKVEKTVTKKSVAVKAETTGDTNTTTVKASESTSETVKKRKVVKKVSSENGETSTKKTSSGDLAPKKKIIKKAPSEQNVSTTTTTKSTVTTASCLELPSLSSRKMSTSSLASTASCTSLTESTSTPGALQLKTTSLLELPKVKRKPSTSSAASEAGSVTSLNSDSPVKKTVLKKKVASADVLNSTATSTTSTTTKSSSKPDLSLTTTPSTESEPAIIKPLRTTKKIVSEDGKVEKKARKTESGDSSKENCGVKPVRQGAVRRKASKDSSNTEINVTSTDGQLVNELAKVKPSENATTTPKPATLEPQATTTKRPSVVNALKQKLDQNGPPLLTSVMAIQKKTFVPEQKAEIPKVDPPTEVKSKVITATTEKKSTKTTETTTNTKRKTTIMGKKIQHSTDGKTIEVLENQCNHEEKKKITTVTKQAESVNDLAPKTSIKKDTVKQDSVRVQKEKQQKEEQKIGDNQLVKVSNLVTDRATDRIDIKQRLTENGNATTVSVLTAKKEQTKKLSAATEVETTPTKTSVKSANATLSQKDSATLELKKDGKKALIKKSSTTKIMITTPVKSPSTDVPDRPKIDSTNSVKPRRVKFGDDLPSSSARGGGFGLQKMKSESCLAMKVQKTTAVKKETVDDMGKQKKFSLTIVDERGPPAHESFAFDALKARLERMVSQEGSLVEQKREPLVIPKTSSVQDRLRKFESFR